MTHCALTLTHPQAVGVTESQVIKWLHQLYLQIDDDIFLSMANGHQLWTFQSIICKTNGPFDVYNIIVWYLSFN